MSSYWDHHGPRRPTSRDMLAELDAAAARRNACDDIASGEVWPVDVEELLEELEVPDLVDLEPIAEPRPLPPRWTHRARQDRGMDPGLFC